MNTYKREYVEALQKLIRIKSVKHDGKDTYIPSSGRPFGIGISEALEYVLELCASIGMRTKNCDGYAGYAEIGEGEDLIGILCHLDVVPEGNGWTYPPYGGEIHDGKLYGRGAIDDKGPAIAVIYAIKALIDEDFDFRKRVRVIFGTDEECDWEDMDYYITNEECPSVGFTPDADFPLIYGEMGILQFDYVIYFEQPGNIIIDGGEASNAVPDYCRVFVVGESEPLIDESGIAAHASVPWEGTNAISKAMRRIKTLIDIDENNISDEMKKFIKFYNNKIGFNLNGEGLGCNFSDEKSGALTFNAGKIRTYENRLCLTIDIRCPISVGRERVLNALRKSADEFGIKIENIDWLDPVYFSPESNLVKTLLKVYREETGDMSNPIAMGGGTYARAMSNIVAFGPVFPGREATEHTNNEYILLEDLHKLIRIYGAAIRRLCDIPV